MHCSLTISTYNIIIMIEYSKNLISTSKVHAVQVIIEISHHPNKLYNVVLSNNYYGVSS